ncbi:MAG: hemolysin family protein [Pseudomonadota bacterium]
MGDTPGSSSAAHSAQPNGQIDQPSPDTARSGGFFSRIASALSPSAESQDAEPAPAPKTPSASHGMINLRRMRVEDVAIPTADIVCLPAASTEDEVLEIFRDSGLTRLPVYDGTLDTPLGFVHLKDFALQRGFNGSSKETGFVLQDILRPLLFVPPSMTIGVLLTKMQTERRHMALVIDEYGGVDGLVTIEDLIEQVIGEIEDEHDTEEEAQWSEEKPGQYVALAKTPLDDFETAIGVTLSDVDEVDPEEVDTLGGMVFMLAGHVPARGEVVRHPAGYEFEVMDADPRRIKRLRVRLTPLPAE